MPVWAAYLLDLIAAEGIDVVLAFLVDQGVLPSWILGEGNTALEHEPYLLEQLTGSTDAALSNPSTGLEAIYRLVQRQAVDVSSILSAIASLSTQVGNLPIPPESGDIASAVWSFKPTLEDDIAWNHLYFLENFAKNIGAFAAFPFQGDPFLIVETSWKYPPD
jgi:hypothetical protein